MPGRPDGPGTAAGRNPAGRRAELSSGSDEELHRPAQGQVPTYLGINHFEKMEDSVVMVLGFPILTFWLHLKDAPKQEHDLYGYEKNGGLFVARQAASVYAGTERQVFQLNYRWHNLGNLPPISYLIDELVAIA